MENRETVFIEVQTDAGKVQEELQSLIGKMASLREQQATLNKEFKAGNISSEEYAKGMLDVKNEMGGLKSQMTVLEKASAGLTAQTKTLDAVTDEYGDSLNEERRKLNDMYKAFDSMSKAMREGSKGEEFLKNIKEQTKKVSELEEATGRHQRSVGNYPKAFNGMIPALQNADGVLGKFGLSLDALGDKGTKAFSGLGTSVANFGKMMITPPIALVVGVLSAIMYASQKLSEAFKKNDDAGTALAKGLAALAPIGEAINKMFDKLAVGIGKVAEKVGAFVGKIFGEASESAIKYVDDLDKLEDKEREYTLNSAKRSKDVADLRNKAVQREKYSTEERIGFLKDAIALEEEDLEERKKLAEEKFRLLKEEAERRKDSSDEMKNKLTQAEAEMYKAQEAYSSGTMRLQSQLNSAIKEEREKDVADFKAKQKEKEDALRASMDLQKAIHTQLVDFQIELIADENERAYQGAKLRGEREIEALKERLTTEKNLTETARKELNDLILLKEGKLEEDLKAMQKKFADEQAEADAKQAEDELKRRLELASLVADRLLENENASTQDKLDALQKEYDLQAELLQNELDRELELLGANEEAKETARQIYREVQLQNKAEFEAEKARITQEGEEADARALESWGKKWEETSATVIAGLQGMQAGTKALGIESKALAVAQKAATMVNVVSAQAQVIANAAIALSAGIKSAAGLPFPLNLAAVASTVVQLGVIIGSIMTTIGTAKSLIGGGGGGSEDVSISASGGGGASSGGSSSTKSSGSSSSGLSAGSAGVESGTTVQKQDIAHIEHAFENGKIEKMVATLSMNGFANLLSIGGVDYGRLQTVIETALRSMPQPVMDYKEFTQFQENVTRLNNI